MKSLLLRAPVDLNPGEITPLLDADGLVPAPALDIDALPLTPAHGSVSNPRSGFAPRGGRHTATDPFQARSSARTGSQPVVHRPTHSRNPGR